MGGHVLTSTDQDPGPSPGPPAEPQRFGRTWADFTVSGAHVIILLALLLVAYFLGALSTLGDLLSSIPLWVMFSFVFTLAWLPWLVRISEDATRLVLVAHGGRTISEWRLGRRVPLTIDGEPLNLSSPSGAQRILVTDFNPDTLEAKGTALAAPPLWFTGPYRGGGGCHEPGPWRL